MANITYVEHDGTEHKVDVAVGVSLMEGAVSNLVPGIDADCGGACACATCHVYVADEWAAETGDKTEMEATMLDFAEAVEATSRLSCQIKVTEAHEGLIVRLPAAQF